MTEAIDIGRIREAASRIAPYIHRTPVMTCSALDALSGSRIFFKCENFQKAGSFKSRGATNAVFSLTAGQAAAGVATHSSGNHAAALALAASRRGIPAYVVMPRTAPAVKVKAVEGYGAEITFCEPTLEARESTLSGILKKTGAAFIHPYDNPSVIAGQGTAALELAEDVTGLDMAVAPVGGGGLLSGTAAALKGIRSDVEVFGAEPAAADDAFRSFHGGEIVRPVDPVTVADGLLTSLSERTFSIIRSLVTDIERVSEDEIVSAMRLIWERMKIVIEPSAAVAVAAVLSGRLDVEGRKTGIILSGGNVDLGTLPWKTGNS